MAINAASQSVHMTNVFCQAVLVQVHMTVSHGKQGTKYFKKKSTATVPLKEQNT
jgi:hypothetical protein